MLEIKKISKTYSNKVAVKNINLKVNNGDICAILGRNGAGKTTILKAAAGILDFNNGDILIENLSVLNNSLDYKKEIAYIPDIPDVYEFLTGFDYLNFICDVYDVKEREEIIKKYSDFFELSFFLGNQISTYSRGMKQKLLIIASLIHEPRVLLFDEPFNSLDSYGIDKLKEVFKSLSKIGTAILFTTNKLYETENLCNKIALLSNGEILEYGDYKAIKKKISNDELMEKNDE